MKKKIRPRKRQRQRRPGKWIDEVLASVGKHVHLETSDGVLREGRFTGLGCREIQINGQAREYPSRIELNGDPSDYIDFSLISRMTIDP